MTTCTIYWIKLQERLPKQRRRIKRAKQHCLVKMFRLGLLFILFIIILQTAVKTLIKKELGEHANDEGFKAIRKYRECAFEWDEKKKVPIEFNIEK
jgi:hypothetical protein